MSPGELVLPSRKRLAEDLALQSNRPFVDAPGRRQQDAKRRLRLLFEKAAERRRGHHRLGETVRDLEDRVDTVERHVAARVRVRALSETPEHVAEQLVPAVDGSVERGTADGKLLREPLHVDRPFAQEMAASTGHDRVVRDHAQVVRHDQILAERQRSV
jgi:hypothetical protein